MKLNNIVILIFAVVLFFGIVFIGIYKQTNPAYLKCNSNVECKPHYFCCEWICTSDYNDYAKKHPYDCLRECGVQPPEPSCGCVRKKCMI